MTLDSFSAALDGVLVLDKPKGPTSHDVVAHVRSALKTRAVGHAGTLDPMATGVLVVAIGEATKLVPWLTGHDKEYEATIALGVATDTLDAEGRVVEQRPIGDELAAALRSDDPWLVLQPAIDEELRRTEQIPPQYSAIKHDGRRAFARARQGEETPLEPRPVALRRLLVTSWSADPPSIAVSLATSKGYYVRALARDLAQALGSCGHLTALRRIRSGPFVVADAVALDAGREALRAAIQPLATSAARALGAARLGDRGVTDALHGRRVRAEDITAPAPGTFAWLDGDGALVAIGEVDASGEGRVIRGFPRAPR